MSPVRRSRADYTPSPRRREVHVRFNLQGHGGDARGRGVSRGPNTPHAMRRRGSDVSDRGGRSGPFGPSGSSGSSRSSGYPGRSGHTGGHSGGQSGHIGNSSSYRQASVESSTPSSAEYSPPPASSPGLPAAIPAATSAATRQDSSSVAAPANPTTGESEVKRVDPTFPALNSNAPHPANGQHIFTHYTNGPQPGFFPYNNPNRTFPSIINTTPVNFAFVMDEYQNTGRSDQGQHFQPQVPDTSFGPHLHTYVPGTYRVGNGYMFAGPVAGGPVPVGPGQSVPVQGIQGYYGPPLNGPYVYPGQQPGYIQQIASPTTPILVQAQPVPQVMQVHMPQGIPQQMHQPVMLHPVGAASGAPGAPGYGPPFGAIHQQVPANVPVVLPGQFPGVGVRAAESILMHAQRVQGNPMFEPQDFKPADDDPGRIYMCRELDQNWTERTRFTIDNIGCRWYLTDEGFFYAVRLPN